MLKGKKILLGVTGSIAAYKAAFLVRILISKGAEVKVILTHDAALFVSPLTLSVLSKNDVLTQAVDDQKNTWNNHVALALWADLLLIAPATANTIAKMTTGICDNLLQAVYLSAKCPIMVAPAMDLDMFAHFTTKQNLSFLVKNGVQVLPSPAGELASGLSGEGRMEEPEKIAEYLEHFFKKKSLFQNKKILITAGPTYEKIDPVRFIGNYSSGKMGFALAEKAAELGADVTLIAGPVHLQTKNPRIQRIDVESTQEMLNACLAEFKTSDVLIMAAAVADYTPDQFSNEKIKKKENFSISLQKTSDILETLGKAKKKKQFICGFALESTNELAYAKSKLERKNLDMIVLNSLKNKGAGFQHDTNQITILDKKNKPIAFALKSKHEVAEDILQHIAKSL